MSLPDRKETARTQPPSESGDIHLRGLSSRDRRDRVYSEIQTKLDIILDLETTKGKFTNDTPLHEITTALAEVGTRAVSAMEQLRPGLSERFERCREAKKRCGSDIDFEASDEELQLMDDPTIAFLSAIDSNISTLADKAILVRSLMEDREAVIAAAQRCYRFEPGQVQEIVITPFSICLVGEELRSGTALGWHMPGTPFNFSRQNDAVTLHHEDVHNQTEGTELRNNNPLARLCVRLDMVRKGEAENFPPLILDGHVKLLRQMNHHFIFREMHGEIVAHLDAMRDLNFGVSREDQAFVTAIGLKAEANVNGRGKFATASSYIKRLCDEIDGLPAVSDSRVTDHLRTIKRELMREFGHLTWGMKENFFVADRLGGAAGEEVRAGYFLFEPKDFHKIEKFLDWKYGEDRVQHLQRLHQVMNTSLLTTENLAFIAEHASGFSEGERAHLSETLTMHDWSARAQGGLGGEGLNRLERYRDALRAAWAGLGDKEEGARRADNASVDFCMEILTEGMADGFKDFGRFRQALHQADPKLLTRALGEYIRGFLRTDLADCASPPGKEALLHSSLAEAARDCGMEAELLGAIDTLP